MSNDDYMENPSEQAMFEQAHAQLMAVFEKMPNDVPLLLFTSPGKNEPFVEAARQVIRGIRESAPKISLREFSVPICLSKTARII